MLLSCHDKWPGQIHAAQMHHGLQAAADWSQAPCVAFRKRLDVPLPLQRVEARHLRGESPENTARTGFMKFLALIL